MTKFLGKSDEMFNRGKFLPGQFQGGCGKFFSQKWRNFPQQKFPPTKIFLQVIFAFKVFEKKKS